MDLTFEGKRVLVTGAGRGIGKGLALRLSNYKACVFGLSKTKKNLDELVRIDPNIHPVCVDLTDWDATRKAIEDILPIDLLVNNAGVFAPAMFVNATLKSFDEIFNVNVKAIFNVTQVVVRSMLQRKIDGRIVNVSSVIGRTARKERFVYSASKAAVDMLTKSMALELGPHNIRVNSVLPIIVMTDMGKLKLNNERRMQEVCRDIPLGRFPEVDEVVDPIIYLLSDRSSIITGVCLPVDGGFLA